jgi:hypothetical protein
LVVANVTATSDELFRVLSERASREHVAFTLLVPATRVGGGLAVAREKLDQAVSRLREAGLEAEGSVGDSDPFVAVSETWDPGRYDEIVISTLPMRFSKWLHAGLPERIFKLTGASVTHIVSEPPKPPLETVPARPAARPSTLGPLSVLAWGKPHETEHEFDRRRRALQAGRKADRATRTR